MIEMSERYEILKQLGTGGFGTVYLAKDHELGRNVAIKRLKINEEDDDAILRDQLLAEAKTLAAMRHPNIVSIFDIKSTEAGGEIVMELVHGVTLDVLVARHLLLIRDFRFVASQMLSAIAASHSHNVLHCDLKPGNIMLCQLPGNQYEVKILDFGMAPEAVKPPEERSGTGKLVGSIFFMAPEQFDSGQVSPQTDVYALGCLFYFLLTGCYPFYGETSVQVMAAHMTGSFTPISDIRPDLPELLCKWVEYHLIHNPQKRYQSCQDSLDALNGLDISGTTEVFTLSSKKTSDSMGSRMVRPITIDSLKEGVSEDTPSESSAPMSATTGATASETSNVTARAPDRVKAKDLAESAIIRPPQDAVWYFSVEEERKGPVSMERLKELCEQGKFERNDLVWHPSFIEWVPAERCADLEESLLAAEAYAVEKLAAEELRLSNEAKLLKKAQQKEKSFVVTPSQTWQDKLNTISTAEIIFTVLGVLITTIFVILKPICWPILWLIFVWFLFGFGMIGTRIRQWKSGKLWFLLGLFVPVVGDLVFAARFGGGALRGVALMVIATIGMGITCIQIQKQQETIGAMGLEIPMNKLLDKMYTFKSSVSDSM